MTVSNTLYMHFNIFIKSDSSKFYSNVIFVRGHSCPPSYSAFIFRPSSDIRFVSRSALDWVTAGRPTNTHWPWDSFYHAWYFLSHALMVICRLPTSEDFPAFRFVFRQSSSLSKLAEESSDIRFVFRSIFYFILFLFLFSHDVTFIIFPITPYFIYFPHHLI